MMISNEAYRKSTFSGSNGCVEVCLLDDGTIGLRDSKDRSKEPHLFTATEWQAFLAGVRNGEFDLEPKVARRRRVLDGLARHGRRGSLTISAASGLFGGTTLASRGRWSR